MATSLISSSTTTTTFLATNNITKALIPLLLNSFNATNNISTALLLNGINNGNGSIPSPTASTNKDDELVFELEESAEGYNKERLIWVFNLIITLIIFSYDIVFLAVYYLFPRVRKNYTSSPDDSSSPFPNYRNIKEDIDPGGHDGITTVDNSSSGSADICGGRDPIIFACVGSKARISKPGGHRGEANKVGSTYWGCPNQCCLHLTWGSLLFLLVKVTVDIFFLKIRYLNPSIMIFSIFLLRLLDATLVFNSVYLLLLWVKTLFNDGTNTTDLKEEGRSIRVTLPRFMRRAPIRAKNDAGCYRITVIPGTVVRFIRRLSNTGICLVSISYGVGCALAITLIFNVRGDHLYYYEYQAVKYSLLIQSLHVTVNVILWAVTYYKYNKLAVKLGVKTTLVKNVKQIRDLTPNTPEVFRNPLAATAAPPINILSSSDAFNVTPTTTTPTGGTTGTEDTLAKHFGSIPAQNLSYYLWISIGNFIVYSPFLWFYLVALIFKPHFINEMLNMQGLIGFLGTLFDLGACIPVFVATFHDKSLRLSFLDLLSCRFIGGGRKSGNMELMT